ncbi:MAG TPA: DUF6221 family protein [Galbitalea sp.]|nr:DUF6221 family protein [Galbitalea sp.]
MTIEEFIEARLDEREEAATAVLEHEGSWRADGFELEYSWVRFIGPPGRPNQSSTFWSGAPTPAEVLRQCAALRLALEFWQGLTRLRTIAAIWSDHRDYQQDWANS